MRDKTNQKDLIEDNTNQSSLLNRREVLTALGTTGLAFIAGISKAGISKPRNGKSTETRIYENVNAMKTDNNLKKGIIAITLGYYISGDGGGSTYHIIVPERSAVADEGSLITISNGLAARLMGATFVNYKTFGAVCDSQFDDGIPIKAAHAYANKENIPVINLSGEYWIKKSNGIKILTNVQWGHSIFHIDEKYNSQSSYRFIISSRESHSEIELDLKGKQKLLEQIKPGVKIIPMLAKYKNSLVFILDKNDRVGYRAGSKYKGQSHSKEEFFYVEEDGRIIGDIAWGFTDYSSLLVYPCDPNYLIIEGGTFYLSGDNPGKTYNGYWKNGFSISRSRTIIRNQWVGLGKTKEDISLTPRSGFYAFSRVYDVILENIRLIPWIQDREGKEKDVGAGTYGISSARTLQARYFNVTAEGGKGYWGVFGTNLNKNFIIDQCKLNRVDVHFHCWNLHIKDSHIGYRGITVTGGGNLIIENTSVWSRRYFISFRRDFGSTWDGNIYINNCRYIPAVVGESAILNFSTANFNYHYPIGFGHLIKVNNLIVDYRSNSDSDSTCWLMKIPSFSQMKEGQRLFLPNQISFESITVEGREKGLRILNIQAPQSYKQPYSGGYDGEELQTNTRFLFNNIQLEKIIPKQEVTMSDVHLLINGHPEQNYIDEYALYPDIFIKDCDNLNVFIAGSANLKMEFCSVQWLTTDPKEPLEGSLILQNCTLKPVIKETNSQPYSLSSKSGTSFINCLFLSPKLNGTSHPELINKSGVIEINKVVRYNHSNSRIGNAIRHYYKNKGIPFSTRFINMLKVHSELESDKV